MADVFILVDPYIFAIPASRAEFIRRNYVATLMSWCQAFLKHRSYCAISENAVYALLADNQFPTREIVQRMLRDYGVTEYAEVDITRGVQVLAQTRPYLEDNVGIKAIAIQRVKVDPPFVVQRLGPQTGSAMVDCCFLASLAKAQRDTMELHIGTCDVGMSDVSVSIWGYIELFEATDGTITELNADHEDVIPLCAEPAYLEPEPEITAIYKDPRCATEYGVDATGNVAGYATSANGSVHAIMWVPVPEPATLSLLAMGGVLLARRHYA